MKQLNLYYLGGGGPSPSVPEGQTVTPTDDVEIWLSCAGITGTGYTTVADVIADTGVLTTVLTDDNANDYLARSTTFASAITADDLAMTTIGQNNYASNKLILNATWINAIVNSQYMQQILNVSVPTMTSNTAPSGKCTASTVYAGCEPFRAFNGDWYYYNSYYHSENYVPQWIGYQFPTAKRICALVLHTARQGGPKKSYLQYSLDGVTWVSAGEFVECASANTYYKKAFIIPGEYAYYRLFCESSDYGGGNNYITINEIQLYGREDVS